MTTYPSIYCDATNLHSPDGCYEPPNHEGRHRGISDSVGEFYWSDETPRKEASPTFTQAEVGILLTALVPVETYFPELRKKLELMQANS